MMVDKSRATESVAGDDADATIVIQDCIEIGIVDFESPDIRRTAAYRVTPAVPESTSTYSTTESLCPVVFAVDDKTLINCETVMMNMMNVVARLINERRR